MRRRAPWLRRAECVLWLTGLALAGGALAVTLRSKAYQVREIRALEERRRGAGGDADPLVLGRIEIPRLGISAIIREGTDDATLRIAVGHIPGTARPGEVGTAGLAGHRDSFFRALRGIHRTDVVRVWCVGGRLEYRVSDIDVVGPEHTAVLAPGVRERLTLVTCFPFDYVGRAPRRFVVHATRVGT